MAKHFVGVMAKNLIQHIKIECFVLDIILIPMHVCMDCILAVFGDGPCYRSVPSDSYMADNNNTYSRNNSTVHVDIVAMMAQAHTANK